MNRVAVIGGGFAGLAAAVSLAEKGIAVTLLERRKRLGGRAYSFTDRTTGDTVDNGQHLFMKCYRHTRDFLALIGTADRLQFQDALRIEFRHQDQGSSTLAFPRWLPPPINLFAGFLRFGSVGWGDVLRLRRVAASLKRPPECDTSVDAWLNTCGQSPGIRRAFWDPLCASALNLRPQDARADLMATVLREAFLGGRDGACIGYAGAGLSALYTDAARRFIEARGGTVRTGAAVTAVSPRPGNRIDLRLKSDETLSADACICAVPPPALFNLLPQTDLSEIHHLFSHLRPSPILSLNLWFDRPIIETEFIGLQDTRIHWVFNKAAIYAGRDRASEGHVTLVASAAVDLVDRPDDELVRIALEDLRATVPGAKNARLLHHRAIKERRATFARPPGSPALPPQPVCPNVYIAGGWTDTGLPDTIEGAVLSGYRAAERVVAGLHRLQAGK